MDPTPPLQEQYQLAIRTFSSASKCFFAAVAMKYAFPISVYLTDSAAGGRSSGGVTMHSISSSLRETMNPRDIMTDAIHNFHPQYQQYTQYSSNGESKGNNQQNGGYEGLENGDQGPVLPSSTSHQSKETKQKHLQSSLRTEARNGKDPEKTLLLSSDDEFQ